MLKYLKEFYWRRVRGYSNGDVHMTEQFIRGSKPFDVVDNASNLIGNFMEAGRSDAAKASTHPGGLSPTLGSKVSSWRCLI